MTFMLWANGASLVLRQARVHIKLELECLSISSQHLSHPEQTNQSDTRIALAPSWQ